MTRFIHSNGIYITAVKEEGQKMQMLMLRKVGT